MTHTSAAGGGGGDDDDDDDGGLGVATVNLAALKAVLTKHQVAYNRDLFVRNKHRRRPRLSVTLPKFSFPRNNVETVDLPPSGLM